MIPPTSPRINERSGRNIPHTTAGTYTQAIHSNSRPPQVLIDLTVSMDQNTSRPTRPKQYFETVPEQVQRILWTEEYLTDTLINKCLRQMFSKHTDQMYLNTYFMETQTNVRNSSEMLRPWHTKLRNHPEKTCYIPICYQQVHWIFLKIDPHTSQIEHYDSLKAVGAGDYTQTLHGFWSNGTIRTRKVFRRTQNRRQMCWLKYTDRSIITR